MSAIKITRIVGFVLLLIGVSILSSCSLFRKKNRCNTCPKWEDHIELVDTKVDFGEKVTNQGIGVCE
jgi:hypothetical protein